MKAGEKVQLGDIVNVRPYKVLNLFIIQLFQHIKISDIE